MKKRLPKRCVTCDRPRKTWPMCFRGDLTCSVLCAKAHAATPSKEKDQ